MTQKVDSPAGTQSLTRALRLLKAFDDTQPEWSLAELVDETGLNKTTAYRLLTALESEGLVRRTASNHYRLGAELIALGGRAMRANQLRTVAHAPLRALANQTGETTTLEVIRPDRHGRLTTLVIDEVLGRYRVGINQYIGSRLPIHATSTGKALMAFGDPEQIDVVLEQQPERFTRQTQLDPAAFRADLLAIRQRGYALAMGELEDGVMACAAPIFDHMGEVQAAISTVGPSIRVDRAQLERFAHLIMETTQEISAALGYTAGWSRGT